MESNDLAQNVIFVFRQQQDGKLKLESQVNSGGKGLGAGLASQGALALDKKNNLLFAVNAGSNSVSSFRIKTDGSLELLHTVASGGNKPVSVTVHGHEVYVLNNSSADVTGFKVSDNGKLEPIAGSHQTLSSAGADPAQISFTPDGYALLVSEKATNKLTAFGVKGDGGIYNKVVNQSVGNTPFGFDILRDQFMVVSNADGGNPGTASCTSYKNLDNLRINAVNGKVNNRQTSACWVAATTFGRYAYVANTGSNTLSAYFVDFSGRLYVIPWVNEKAGEQPADIIVSSDNRFVYNINGGSNTLGEYKRGILGKLQLIGYINDLPDFAAGLVSY
jgi:6-phosphogluconolactonase (cycloisomerase 2 family)